METRLPDGLSAARKTHQKSSGKTKYYILTDHDRIEVLDCWEGGFSTNAEIPCLTRGVVDLYSGKRHLAHGLAYLASVEEDCRVYAFKLVRDPELAPPSDHVRLHPTPAALLPG